MQHLIFASRFPTRGKVEREGFGAGGHLGRILLLELMASGDGRGAGS